MIIVGAKGFAKQLVEIFYQRNLLNGLYFFDNINIETELYDHHILKTLDEAQAIFSNESSAFSMGVGGPSLRHKLAGQMKDIGGKIESVISPFANIASKSLLQDGVTILTGGIIENDAVLEEGVLINTHASIHHDSRVGRYAEIAPGARILGGCTIEEFAFIGANAVILPKIKIGAHAIVGAGAIVTKNVEPYSLVVGNPARHVRFVS